MRILWFWLVKQIINAVLDEDYRRDEIMTCYNKLTKPSLFDIFCNVISITCTISKFDNLTFNWLDLYVKVTNLSFANEQMHAAELSQLRDFCLQTTPTVSEVKVKVKEVDLYSAFIEVPYTQGAQVRITQCYLQTTPYLPEVLRSRSPCRSLPPRPVRRMLTHIRCRSIAVHRRWCRFM